MRFFVFHEYGKLEYYEGPEMKVLKGEIRLDKDFEIRKGRTVYEIILTATSSKKGTKEYYLS